VIRGELVEKLPGQYVTVRLSTGEHRRIRWDYIVQVSEGNEAPKIAHVFFRSEDSRATLQRLSPNGTWFNVCRTPCTGKVAGRGLYRVAGDGVTASEPFRLPTADGYVGIETTRVSGEGTRTLGAVLALGGGAVAYIGLLVLSISAQNSYDDYGNQTDNDNDDNDAAVTGLMMMLGGAGAGIAGIVMMVRGKTLVHVAELKRRQAGRPLLERPELSIPLGNGFALTERGLSF
jgi:hypothetical protein